MIKIITILGARPQFIKAAMLTKKICEKYQDKINEIMIHTGQHYDHLMSGSFFEEFDLPKPKYNLHIHETQHGAMIGKMLIGVEEILTIEKPDAVIVYGDTNSTLAGALAAKKLHIPIIHVESGLRSFNPEMPEEINRILTDHMSSILICPNKNSINNLKKENIQEGVFLVGDIMYEATLFALKNKNFSKSLLHKLSLLPKSYSICTIHRSENTSDVERLNKILRYIENESQETTLVFPVHPRTQSILSKNNIRLPENVMKIEPLRYIEMINLINYASCVYTDSGGVQKEAYYCQTPCITLRDETEWVETIESGWNRLWNSHKEPSKKVNQNLNPNVSDQIINIIQKYFYA